MDRGAWTATVHGVTKSGVTEQLDFRFSLSCIGEGNGNPLQCSCLENPRGRGAWWAADCGVAQSRTRLTRLSSSRRGAMLQVQRLEAAVGSGCILGLLVAMPDKFLFCPNQAELGF